MELRILYSDGALVAVDKPAAFHVHPPEDARIRISPMRNVLYIVSRQLGAYLYPVHRLDYATSGVLLFGRTAEAARSLAASFRAREIEKTYYAVARGYLPADGSIARELTPDPDSPGERGVKRVDALTDFQTVAQVEIPYANDQHPTSRYSLVRVMPHTGRRHQIRRHFAREAHPLVGDALYGHGVHNRIFRDELKIPGLLLRAQSIRFAHPVTGAPCRVDARWNTRWHRVFAVFGTCPFSAYGKAQISEPTTPSTRNSRS